MLHAILFGMVVLGVQLGMSRGSSEGTRFAFALPPAAEDVNSELILLSKDNTMVLLQFPFLITFLVELEPNEPHYFAMDDLMPRCEQGVEERGVIITSDNPITLHLSQREFTHVRNPDSTIVRPLLEDDTSIGDIFIMSYQEASTSGNANFRPKSFFQVVGQADNTYVQVFQEVNDTFVVADEFTLETNQVFTHDTWQVMPGSQMDVTGLFVRASKPVSVYSGHGCALTVSAQNEYSRSLYESMPPNSGLGTTYVTSPLHFGSNEYGSVVRVLSVEDGTTVSIPGSGYEEEHDMASFYELDFPLSRQATSVFCSQPCLVTQYAKQAEAGDSPGERHMGSFMLVLTPQEAYISEAVFSTPSFDDDTEFAMSIIVDFYPVEDLYLDGENLDYLDWTPAAGEAGYFATVSVDTGAHNLTTTSDDNSFAAYLYGTYAEEVEEGRSFGYSIGYGDIDLTP